MRVTITPVDRMVYVDGDARKVHDHVPFPEHIHAVQWYHDHGEIEFKDHHRPNEKIGSLKDFEGYLDHHKAAKERDEELARAKQVAAEQQAETERAEATGLYERVVALETKVDALVRKVGA